MRRARTFSAKRLVERVSVPEAWERVLIAARTMQALPPAHLRGIVSSWPSEFDFHATAIKVAVFSGDLEDKKFLKLRAADFDDICFDKPDEDASPRRAAPSKRDISDIDVAGRWFAAIAGLPCNEGEFRDRLEAYRQGRAPNPQVTDQRILTLFAEGFGFRFIAGVFKSNEHEIEGRLFAIREAVWKIANGTQRLVEPARSPRSRGYGQAHMAGRRARG